MLCSESDFAVALLGKSNANEKGLNCEKNANNTEGCKPAAQHVRDASYPRNEPFQPKMRR